MSTEQPPTGPEGPDGPLGYDCWTCAWETTRSLSDQAACMVAWLQGRHLGHPGHSGPMAEETVPLVEPLTTLCGTGLVPTNSQPGLVSGPWRQRAYLTGYGPRRLVEHVVGVVDRNPGMRAQMWRTSWETPVCAERHTVSLYEGLPATHLGAFGLTDTLAGLDGMRLSLDAEAALEGSVSFWLLDEQWERPDALFQTAADAAAGWVVTEAAAGWQAHPNEPAG